MYNINKYEGSVSVDAKVDANVSIFFSGMSFSTLLVETKTVLYDWKQNPFKHRRAFQQTDFVEVSNDRTSKYQ